MATPDIRRLGHEIKYVLPLHQVGQVAAILGRLCVPDPEYPIGVVASLYFDTPQLHLLREKMNSDYFKTKVRVRWYEDPANRRPIGAAYVESKRRVGTRRFKVRSPSGRTAAWLATQPLTSLELQRFPDQLRAEGAPLPAPLLPLLEVRYHRRRYVEPFSGARIALDADISTGRCNPSLATRRSPQTSGRAVLEVKGFDSSLPPTLRSLGSLGCRRSSFSKYAVCCQALNFV